jgi:predicted CXXCH cytochrome family protein
MRKLLILFLAMVLVAGLVTVSTATIKGTRHDLSGLGGVTEICIFCHTPHHADISVANAPLWNHEVTSQTFTPYTSATLDAAVGQPDGISKLCLSCHDGVTNVDAFGGNPGTNPMTFDDAIIGLDLRDDHPISFTYDDSLASTDGGLWPPSSTSSGLGGTIQADLLFANQLECGSCHDVHDNTLDPFLRIDNSNQSALCLTCHDK